MNFKEEYQKENNRVVPDPSFMTKLEEQMKELNSQQNDEKMDLQKQEMAEHKKKNSYNKSRIIPFIAVGAAACMCLAVYYYNHPKLDKEQLQQKAELESINDKGDSIGKVSEGMFSEKKWYDDKMQPEDIYHIFLDRISDDENIKQIYYSDTQDEFNEDSILADNDKKQLQNDLNNSYKIESTNENNLTVNDSNNATYYMITFSDDVIIKFCIYDKKVVINSLGFEAIYE